KTKKETFHSPSSIFHWANCTDLNVLPYKMHTHKKDGCELLKKKKRHVLNRISRTDGPYPWGAAPHANVERFGARAHARAIIAAAHAAACANSSRSHESQGGCRIADSWLGDEEEMETDVMAQH
ncbi:3499_t:CDS:1, partial [Paraglomus occultum]